MPGVTTSPTQSAVSEQIVQDEVQCIALCPVCEHVSRPRTLGVDAWDCIARHVGDKARNGCDLHGMAWRALTQNTGRGFGCPGCSRSFESRSEALSHFRDADDEAHNALKRCAAEPEPRRRPSSLSEQVPHERGPVAGAVGWQQMAASSAAGDPARLDREEMQARVAAVSLYAAAKMGHSDAVARHLEAGADPNEQHDDGYTPLMTAAEAGHSQVVRILGANPRCSLNLRNAYGQSALHFAALNGRDDAVTALLECREQHKLDAVDVEALCAGQTAAELARRAGYVALADRLALWVRDVQLSRCLAALTEGNASGNFDSLHARICRLCDTVGCPRPVRLDEIDEQSEIPESLATCSICLVEPIDTALTPCFHASFCGGCAGMMVNSACPICRKPVNGSQRIYF